MVLYSEVCFLCEDSHLNKKSMLRLCIAKIINPVSSCSDENKNLLLIFFVWSIIFSEVLDQVYKVS